MEREKRKLRSIGEGRDAEKKESREGARYMKWETTRVLSKGMSDHRLRKPGGTEGNC